MRFFLPALAALLLTAAPIAAKAQISAAPAPTTLPDTPAPKAKAPRVSKLDKRFTTANTTHDGHLTLEQARAAKWAQVVKNFTTIDVDKKGYVTEDNIRTAAVQARVAKAKVPTKS